MYRHVGDLPEPRRWADQAVRHFAPFTFSAEGYATTDRGETRDYFASLLHEWFLGDWAGASLIVVLANGTIPPHCDGDNGGRWYRRMAVLQGNEESWARHNGDWQRLVEGGIYAGDFTQPHAALNWGAEPRIHLVVDTVT